MRIIARTDDGTETDITDDVRATYDIAVGSMDFGSGFLDAAEVAHLHRINAVIGGEPLEYQSDPCDNCAHGRDYHREDGCRHRVHATGTHYGNWIADRAAPECDCPGFVFDGAHLAQEVEG